MAYAENATPVLRPPARGIGRIGHREPVPPRVSRRPASAGWAVQRATNQLRSPTE
ncbi:hypothetical protein F4561_005345 [Lipingzhangella halophila]|uniref:Uncharacterized protein n=1 Tax=Lipingzhangella halophila TaxID=1783352 RepID=A0A7W7RM49_9ACTN|nr:hypothetical protein [Lipingzhangella halophila]